MDAPWLIGAAIVFLIVIVTVMVRKDDPFKVAATGLGLKLTRTVPDLIPNLDGMVDGFAVKIDISSNRDPAIRYEVFYPALGMALRLERETTITRTLGQLGSSDPQVGAKPFDDSFRVNTSRPDALRTMMTPVRRRQLIQLIENYPKVVVDDGSIQLVGDSPQPTAESIIATTRDLVAAAATLVEGRPPPLTRPEPTRPPTATTQPAAPAAIPASGRADTTLQGVETLEQSPQPEPEPTAEPPPPPPAPEPSPTGLPDDFFENVFGANRLSFEDDNTFESEVRGATVTLTGKVKQSTAYGGDDERAPSAGTKAVVTVAQIDNDLYGMTDIDAVVYLQSTAAGRLDRGDDITFRGTIDKVDPFMRNVFIIEASLTS